MTDCQENLTGIPARYQWLYGGERLSNHLPQECISQLAGRSLHRQTILRCIGRYITMTDTAGNTSGHTEVMDEGSISPRLLATDSMLEMGCSDIQLPLFLLGQQPVQQSQRIRPSRAGNNYCRPFGQQFIVINESIHFSVE